MADLIKRISYFSMDVANKPGEGARILRLLSNAGINLLAFTGFPQGRRAQIDLVPENTALFRRALARTKLKVRPNKTGFLVQGIDRPGAVAEITRKLAEAKINLTAMDAISAGKGRYGAILWVKPKDVNKAAKALKAV
jgi:hypothetical protein